MSNLALVSSYTKCCNKCKVYLPFEVFAKNSANKDKLSNRCKPCDKIYQESLRVKKPHKRLEYNRKYKAKVNDDFNYRLKCLLNASKQRAKLKNIEHTLTLEELKTIYPIDNKCPVFGTELKFGNAGFKDNSPSIDKIDPKGGYTLDNVQVISWRANRLKVDASINELEMLLAFMKQGE
jgi:hypothetical protein